MHRFQHTAIALLSTAVLSLPAMAQNAPAAPATATAASTYVAPPWTYKTQQLSRNDVDKLLGNPKKLLIIDVRRPDELGKNGSFPVYLSVQIKDLPEALEYIPKDRVIVTVSNRAHRAGAAGDLLSSKGYKVAGAVGSLDYAEAGGSIAKITPPPAPATSATTPAATLAATVPAAGPAASR
ncbi:rhodanese-like domain-containing protein [Aquabacterium sp.]|uniref:rhodanese-like domain-containing protein n=1 Tax=Aquabacterium sp. TaxID=1872578 RepID=UPI0024894528|nr:rhodanese-like domain-containing protein [Aquabacterium sp.]MDI1347772.1 rhodanese-like domain-containing protein [Aquabacterium sp.]